MDGTSERSRSAITGTSRLSARRRSSLRRKTLVDSGRQRDSDRVPHATKRVASQAYQCANIRPHCNAIHRPVYCLQKSLLQGASGGCKIDTSHRTCLPLTRCSVSGFGRYNCMSAALKSLKVRDHSPVARNLPFCARSTLITRPPASELSDLTCCQSSADQILT